MLCKLFEDTIHIIFIDNNIWLQNDCSSIGSRIPPVDLSLHSFRLSVNLNTLECIELPLMIKQVLPISFPLVSVKHVRAMHKDA